MPTRIVLNKAAARTPLASNSRSAAILNPGRSEELSARTTMRPSLSTAKRKSSRKRAVVSFPSSLLREAASAEMNTSSEFDFDRSTASDPGESTRRLSSDDIRASPRLMGYLFAMTTGAVMLVSVFQFYRNEVSRLDSSSESGIEPEKYYSTATGLVFRWKLWAAIYLSATAVALSFGTFLVHFDTVVFPTLWVSVFRDGSLAERNWIIFLLIVWIAALHVSTSVLSVGEYQPNVYFTSWIGFGAMALNYGVWRDSAGLVTTETMINQFHRETTYNWIWTGICSSIFAGAATDIYYNRELVRLRFRGERLDLKDEDWILILSVIWSEVALCCLTVALNEVYFILWHFPCRFRRDQAMYRFEFGWRQIEGIIILVSTGAKFWAILEYSGVDGVINGLSNAYFGLWGSFFNSVFAFGTWLYENKHLEAVVREDAEREEDDTNINNTISNSQ